MGTQNVNPYHKRDGTRVSGHTRQGPPSGTPSGADAAAARVAAQEASRAGGEDSARKVLADRLRGHKLVTKGLEKDLLQRGRKALIDENYESRPVMKIFGGSSATYLVAEIDPREPDQMFGLADLGHGFPEMGYFSRSDIEEAMVPPLNMPFERDLYWQPNGTLEEYARASRSERRIVDRVPEPSETEIHNAETGNDIKVVDHAFRDHDGSGRYEVSVSGSCDCGTVHVGTAWTDDASSPEEAARKCEWPADDARSALLSKCVCAREQVRQNRP